MFLLCSFNWVEKETDDLESEEFKDSYGAIIENIELEKSGPSRFFYPLYLYRRLLYAAVLLFLIKYPLVQIVVIMAALVVPVIFAEGL